MGDLNIARAGHTATLLKDGRVLIAGGDSTCFADLRGQPLSDKNIGCNGPLKSLEIYDPKSQKFSLAGDMNESHEMPNAPLLPDGRVIFIGAPGTHAEIYDPATGQVTLSGKMLTPRKGHTVTLLKDGSILIAGGNIARKQGIVTLYEDSVDSAEIFKPQTGQFALTGKMIKRRADHQAVLLPDGKVFIGGGELSRKKSVEFYDPSQGVFRLSTLALGCKGIGRSVVIKGGKVLIFECYGPLDEPITPAEIIDLNQQTLRSSKTLIEDKNRPAITKLDDENILITGGTTDGFGSSAFLKTAEIYDAKFDHVIKLPDMRERRLDNTATRLQDGNVLIVGGHVVDTYHRTSELFVLGKE